MSKKKKNSKVWYTIGETASMSGLSEGYIRTRCNDGTAPAIRQTRNGNTTKFLVNYDLFMNQLDAESRQARTTAKPVEDLKQISIEEELVQITKEHPNRLQNAVVTINATYVGFNAELSKLITVTRYCDIFCNSTKLVFQFVDEPGVNSFSIRQNGGGSGHRMTSPFAIRDSWAGTYIASVDGNRITITKDGMVREGIR